MLIRDGAPTQDGNWNLSANGLSVVQQDQPTLFPRHDVPVGYTTPAQRRIATPPIPYTLPPGGRIRLNITGRFVEINNPTISHSEVPIGDLSIQNSEGGAETLSIRDSSQGFGVLTGQVLVSTRILDANAPNLTVTLHSMNRREQSRFSISREEALARGFITRAGDHYVTNPRLEERMMLLDDSMNVTSQDLERANSLSRRATPAAASTDATVVEPDFGDSTNPNMALPAFVNINPSVNLITVGGQAPTFPTMTNVNLPRLTPQTIPPIIFRRSNDGHTWNVNIQEGNVVLINGHLVDSGSEIHMNDRLQIVTRVEGHTLTHNGRITDRGLEIEGSTQTQEGDSTLQTAARGPTVETPPRRRN
ncbi:MAG: hypothetical protein IPJ69_08380 [Deltaproteobacteria bacterium]|nr:MAG: hypothetical protein IPJ69_08380 [Deltaproteobacteria bacterium]